MQATHLLHVGGGLHKVPWESVMGIQATLGSEVQTSHRVGKERA